MVLAVEHDYLDLLAVQSLGGVEPGKARADDDDTWQLAGGPGGIGVGVQGRLLGVFG
jgi:hypothetical protein